MADFAVMAWMLLLLLKTDDLWRGNPLISSFTLLVDLIKGAREAVHRRVKCISPDITVGSACSPDPYQEFCRPPWPPRSLRCV